jgi:hypothetical protein
LALKTCISYGLSYCIAILLFNKAIVIFSVWTASGELNAVLNAKLKELMVNKLSAIITVNTEHGERQACVSKGDVFLDPTMGVIQQGGNFSPG